MRIDLAWMLRRGLAKPGQSIAGKLSWTCRGEPSGNINYTCDMRDPDCGLLELRFTHTSRRTGQAKDHVQRVPLSHTQPHFGGRRWWMHCPVTGERVGKLYVPAGGDIFASRKAWRIGYRSQRVTARDKPFEALNRLQRRLGVEEGWGGYPLRPKGMHRRTYEPLERRYWELEDECERVMVRRLGNLRASIAR